MATKGAMGTWKTDPTPPPLGEQTHLSSFWRTVREICVRYLCQKLHFAAPEGITNMKRKVTGFVGAAVFLSSVGLVGPALAAEPEPIGDEAISAIESVAPESLEAAAVTQSDGDNAATYSSEFVTTEVPRTPDAAVSLSGADGDLLISLPFSDQATEALTDSGVPEFDNNNGSTTVPIVRGDGSVQIITVIDDPSAPTRFDYTISVPEGGAMTLDERGVILITDQAGDFVGAVAPAWAKDANGESLQTRYEIDGNVLTQVVEHSAANAYPVVADPWLGIQLFGGFYRSTWNGDYTYNATVTPLGAVVLSGGGGVGGYLAGQAVFRTSGWDEWKAVWPAITNKATLWYQYECHVTAGNYGLPFTGTYNLERARTNYANWGTTVISHHCNW